MQIGILGAARITTQVLIEPARVVDGVELRSVVARDPQKAAEYAALHGIPRVFATYEEVLDDPDVDVVYVPLVNSLHARWTIAALNSGKHVLCEKPIGSNAQQAAEMHEAALRNDRLLIEAFHWRYHPVAERMLELCAAIGPLEDLTARLSVRTPPGDTRFQLDLSGGAVMDLGSYCINMVRAIVGSEPVVESARSIEDPPGIDATTEAVLRFPAGLRADIYCSMVGVSSWPESMSIRAKGAGGSLEVLNSLIPHVGHRITAQLADGQTLDEVLDAPSTYECQLRAFVEIIAGNRAPLTGSADAIKNMTVIDAIYDATGLGRRG